MDEILDVLTFLTAFNIVPGTQKMWVTLKVKLLTRLQYILLVLSLCVVCLCTFLTF